ncbi:MtN3-like protein [Phytophthora megakarya]|uniref:MtN3-like protein n=1 Tax=Phytophthora megakarya TaxID=4795 RepID=A0A225UL43_9STRA|nr:MtN3-like protein [Phytophthora megakarya]
MTLGLTIIQVLASICSVAMILSSVPAMYRIHKRQDTGEVALFPLVGLWINCHVLMLYGWATADYFPLFATYLFGDIVAVMYIVVFFRWTKQRGYALKAIGASFVVVVITAVYTILGMTGVTGQSTDQVGLVTGYMMAVGSVLLYISPFETIKTVLKTRSGASIPFGMCLAGATSNVLWMINGLLTSDIFIFLLGTVCASLGLVQVVLYLIYRPGRAQVGVEVVVEQIQPGKKFVLPTTVLQHNGTTDSLPSPVFIAVHSP